ncbi:MAG: branched-chain amino acid transport system substrate-binding protein [Alphaproteobacteria bacterium]|jgi:branched-chain amino acid transport system substrate-binding protein
MSFLSKFQQTIAVTFYVLAITIPHTHAEIGVFDTEIKIGMSNALTGPAKALGFNLKEGAEIHFKNVNDSGGVYGRKIKLVSYDDGYEPAKTIVNTINLLKKDKVFALFGYVGTPTSKVAVPIAINTQTPYLFPFTGAEFLRTPVNKYVFNIRSSYFDETQALVDHIVHDLGIKKIGAFIQNDGYGADGRYGIQRALESHGLKISAIGKYQRNTLDVTAGLQKILTQKPEAIIMIGAYAPCAAFIKQAKALNYSPIFLNISFVGTNALVNELNGQGEGSYISQVMPHPTYSGLPIIEQYRKDLKKANKEDILGFVSLEGYINAHLFVEALKINGPDLTRSSFISTLESMHINSKGLNLNYSEKNHQGLNKVYLTKIKDGKVVTVDNLEK